jgi:putative transposase
VVSHLLDRTSVRPLFVEPGSPWENGYCRGFKGKLRDEVLDREIFSTLGETEVIIDRWRTDYNSFWAHSSIGCSPPAPQALFKTSIVQNMPEMIVSPRYVRTPETLT